MPGETDAHDPSKGGATSASKPQSDGASHKVNSGDGKSKHVSKRRNRTGRKPFNADGRAATSDVPGVTDTFAWLDLSTPMALIEEAELRVRRPLRSSGYFMTIGKEGGGPCCTSMWFSLLYRNH
eukprot:1181904-Prorocentrum_minimum.AAC.5